jgi:peptidase E
VIHQGKIVLMGSGEFTATMVEVHKAQLRPYGKHARAVFMDTPAGFQLNVDTISQKAEAYFNTHVQHPLTIASFKSAQNTLENDAPDLWETLRRANYLLIGPGSPTYALRQWKSSPIPHIWQERLASGMCLVAASAAALAVGRFTLPVYEIYKVGETPYWVEGLNLLEAFGLNAAVVPHWNNAEGGNHDTRFCFLGEQRLLFLEDQLPDDTDILGIDEHTALIIDARTQTAHVRGRGTITIRRRKKERIFKANDSLPLSLLQSEASNGVTPEYRPLPSKAKLSPEADQMEVVWEDLCGLVEEISRRVAPDRVEEVGQAIRVLVQKRRDSDPHPSPPVSDTQYLATLTQLFNAVVHT